MDDVAGHMPGIMSVELTQRNCSAVKKVVQREYLCCFLNGARINTVKQSVTVSVQIAIGLGRMGFTLDNPSNHHWSL